MSHVRIWRSNGIVYFAGQIPVENAIPEVHEGTFGGDKAAKQMAELSLSLLSPTPQPLRSYAKDE